MKFDKYLKEDASNDKEKFNHKQVVDFLRKGGERIDWKKVTPADAERLLAKNTGIPKSLWDKLWKKSRERRNH